MNANASSWNPNAGAASFTPSWSGGAPAPAPAEEDVADAWDDGDDDAAEESKSAQGARLEQLGAPELRIDCPDTVKFDSMEKIRAHVLSGHDAADVNSIDGVRVRSGDGWWLIRASNTEAALVARAEAADRTALDRLLGDIETTLAAAGLDWKRP